MSAPELSVVTVTRGRVALLQRKVDALAQQTLPARTFEWRVLANGDPQAAALLRGLRTPFETVVLESGENLPIGAARNRAAAGARGRVLLMSDDDCLPGPASLASHLAAQTAWPGCVAIGPLRLPEELRRGRRREPFERALQVGGRALWINATGANTSLPRAAFQAVGGYDERFVGYGGEDPDLALRLRRAGARFRHVAEGWAYHAGRILGQDPQRAFQAGRAHRLIYQRNPTLEVGLLLGVHPWLLPLKRGLLRGPLRRLLPDEVAAYESAYLDGALSLPAAGGAR